MVLRVRTTFTGVTGTPWLNTMFFQGSSTEADAQAAADAVSNFWGSVDTHISTSVSWTTEADVADINELTGALRGVFSTTPGSGAGSSAGSILPFATQALVRWRTGQVVATRELRGRTFIPGLTELAADDGNLVTTVSADIKTAADALVAETIEFAVYSPTHSTSEPVTAATVWSQFAVQRSRRD